MRSIIIVLSLLTLSILVSCNEENSNDQNTFNFSKFKTDVSSIPGIKVVFNDYKSDIGSIDSLLVGNNIVVAGEYLKATIKIDSAYSVSVGGSLDTVTTHIFYIYKIRKSLYAPWENAKINGIPVNSVVYQYEGPTIEDFDFQIGVERTILFNSYSKLEANRQDWKQILKSLRDKFQIL